MDELVSVDLPKELYSALHKAQAQVKPVGKSGYNKYHKYSYATLEDYWKELQRALCENDLAFVCSVVEVIRLDDRKTKEGNMERAVQLILEGTLTHKSGESMVIRSYGEGQDVGDKAIYKAHTGARKYLIASILGMPTTDDPESDSDSERETGEKKENKSGENKQKPSGGKITKDQFNQLMESFKSHEIRLEEWKKYSAKVFDGKSAAELTPAELAKLLITIEQEPKTIDPEAIPF